MHRFTLLARRPALILTRGIQTCRRPLIGPPDAVSNLRPVLYDPPRAPGEAVSLTPYSVHEFTSTEHGKTVEEEGERLKWRLNEEELDAFNQSFWTQNNVRFQAAKQAVLDQYRPLAASASPDEVAIREMEHEQALQEFYARWVQEEKSTNFAYTREWYRRIYSSLWPGLKRQWTMFKSERKAEHDAKDLFALILLGTRRKPRHTRTRGPTPAKQESRQ